MVKVTRNKETYLGLKEDYNKRKTVILKEIVNNNASRRPMFKGMKNIQTFSVNFTDFNSNNFL